MHALQLKVRDKKIDPTYQKQTWFFFIYYYYIKTAKRKNKKEKKIPGF